MKIEFITLSTDGKQTFSRDGKYPLPIRAPLFTALTPKSVELSFQDQNFAPIDKSTSAEVVAISLNTPVAHRAYELGAEFRSQGKIVVYGGPHITQVYKYPKFRNEMFEIGGASVAFVGDAEQTWPLFVDDLVKGTLKERYFGNSFRFEDRVIPDRETYRKLLPEGFLPDNEITTVESSRGCPNSCTFCTTNTAYTPKPIDYLIAEITGDTSSTWHFTDSNIAHNHRRLEEITDALSRLGITYSASISTQFANERNVSKLAESGCVSVYVGFESVNPGSLGEARKRFNKPSEYADTVKLFHDYGVQVVGAVIFGFDHDTPDVFERTWDFIKSSELDQVSFHVLIPYPGTPLFNQLRSDGRLLYTNFPEDWKHYGYDDVAYIPKNMTPESLLENKIALEKRFRQEQSHSDVGVASTNTGSYRHLKS